MPASSDSSGLSGAGLGAVVPGRQKLPAPKSFMRNKARWPDGQVNVRAAEAAGLLEPLLWLHKVTRVLRAERIDRDLTLDALARRAGLSADTVGKFERGVRWPELPTLWKVANALEMPLQLRDPKAETERAAT